MKKIFVLLLALTTAFTLAACGGGGAKTGSGTADGGSVPSGPAKIADDTAVLAMSFTPPEGYATVQRFIQETSDGNLREKDLTYTMPDEKQIIFACGTDQDLTLPEDMEKVDVGGKEFALRTAGNQIVALHITEDHTLYAVSMETDDPTNREPFDKLLEGISFTDAKTTTTNEFDEGNLSYTLDPSWNVSDTVTALTETPSGEPAERYKSLYFGQDPTDADFIFTFAIYPNAKVEDELSADNEYTQQEINGITYTVRVPSEGDKPFEFYTQQGSDVYRFMNKGSDDLFSTRSEESQNAFETFMNSVSFK